jgi:hypothetical protein
MENTEKGVRKPRGKENKVQTSSHLLFALTRSNLDGLLPNSYYTSLQTEATFQHRG